MMSSPIARDRMIRIVLLIVLSLGLETGAAMAAGSSVPVGAEKETLKECSSCHMAYPPEMLPGRSGQKIWGVRPTLWGGGGAPPGPGGADIEAYLMANA